jgi:hypothetical protein
MLKFERIRCSRFLLILPHALKTGMRSLYFLRYIIADSGLVQLRPQYKKVKTLQKNLLKRSMRQLG